ncbi:SLP adapter and CSK-interacting membrane protein isoform X1 [Pteropus alecto]|uniref:SLP adapter and CSK-interacting membrane protein isoform X1 n=1 Tax=Pteropus alecto TaxID=9402 RepID=UPI0003F125C6|nr:SLP adapter and CSK-interacting membrane protein isoform X1 [Pteropus alecto]
MDWWRDNFWIILAVAIVIVSVVLGLILYCVCRRLLTQGKKLKITKPLKQIQRDDEMMYENVNQSPDQLPPLPPRNLLPQLDTSPQETASKLTETYSLVNKVKNKKTTSIPSYVELECDYDDVEIPADMENHHFQATVSSFWQAEQGSHSLF